MSILVWPLHTSLTLNQAISVTISGPYGEFFIKDTDAEMLYIGGGAGMAPMRSHYVSPVQNPKNWAKGFLLVWRSF